MSTPNIVNHVPLTQDEATKIAGAYAKIADIQSRAIRTPTDDAELSGNFEFLTKALVAHANEFIGCWFAVRNEYEPLIGVFSNVAARVRGIIHQNDMKMHLAQQQAQAQQQANQAAAPASNIVTLNGGEAAK